MMKKVDVFRICIYTFSDQQGIADGYIAAFLDEMMRNVDVLIVVSCCRLKPKSMELFEKYKAKMIQVNPGMVPYAAGLKELSRAELNAADEIVFCSDKIIGPFYPLKDVFAEMAEVETDAWGITKEILLPDWQYDVPFFLVCRKSIICDQRFFSLVDHTPGPSPTISERLKSSGFIWKAYVQSEDIDNLNPALINTYPKELIGKRKCPFLLTDIFSLPYLNVCQDSNDEEKLDLIQFIAENNSYDTNLIWDHVLRTCYQNDFVQNLHLNYVLPTKETSAPDAHENTPQYKIALMMHLYYPDMLSLMRQYAASIPEDADVFVTVSNDDMKQLAEEQFADLPCNHLEIRRVRNRGRNESAFLVGLKDVIPNYDLICFVHDKKSSYAFPGSVGDSFFKFCLENTLGSKAYVSNVISLFSCQPRLGISCLPPMVQGMFYYLCADSWTESYPTAQNLAGELKLTVPMDKNAPTLIPWGGMFWVRVKALKTIRQKDWQYEDFPDEKSKIMDGSVMHALERSWSLTVQQSGYYPAIILSDRAARLQFTNSQYYLSALNKTLSENGIGLKSGFFVVLQQIKMLGHLPIAGINRFLFRISRLRARIRNLASK